jgi:hypothetical protein
VTPKAAKQGFWLRFNHSWDPRVVSIRNFQTVSKTLHANKSRQAQRLYVDHCHTMGQIRGLLCFKCNRKIAPFESNEDWLRRALIYLQLLESAETLDTDPSKLLDN